MSKEISIFLCNVQFTKDAGAFCVTGVKLDNATTIATFDPNEKTYNINGKDVQGHFMVDYTAAQIDHNVSISDAHKQGLEVYASGFANDFFSSYDYNYDPTAEYLQFIAKDECVDGLVTDFPSTASNSIASGVYPGSTDLAYQQAIDDGADIIDCSVQMTKDGISFCSNTADLMADTTAMTKFMSRTSNVPEIQPNSGIFSFDLTWNEIQSLQPQIANPLGSDFQRNPANKNSGKFVTLLEFLELAKDKAVTGILINIENAAYLASKKGLDIVGTISAALSNATFDKQATQQVLIQSDDSSVLSKYKGIPSYKRVLLVENKIGDATKESVDEIKKYAEAVNLRKTSLVKASGSLLTGMTNVVKEMKDANLTVYVHTLRNEFISLAFDYWSDPNVEISTYIHSAKVDGIITDFPATTSRYLRSPCSDLNNVATILPAKAGELESTVSPTLLPPAEAPLPPLEVANIVDPPLPAVINHNPPATPSSPPPSSAYPNAANLGLSILAIIVLVINLAL
ncbi:hypothetical protein RYX36_005300 [Vicia faba]